MQYKQYYNFMEAIRDQNRVTVALGVSSTSAVTPLPFTIDSSTGRLLVDSSGGGSGSFTVETPVGVVDGSNVTFTVSHTPKAIVTDGTTRFAGLGYTYSAPTITVDALLAPVSYIRSLY